MRLQLSALLGMIALAGVALGQERTISVNGTATVYVTPDTARIYYGVRVSEPSADAVKDVLTKTNKAIDDAVLKLKLFKLTVTRAPIGIKHSQGNDGQLGIAGGGPPPGAGGPGGGGLGPFVGYSRSTATLTNKDFEKLRADVEAFVKTITDAGANTNGSEPRDQNINIFPGQETSDGPKIVLSISNDTTARDQALQQAVEKAVQNAKAIAKGLGGGEIKVLSVTDSEPEKPAPEPLNIYGIESPSTPRIPAGQIEVKVRVVVKCSY